MKKILYALLILALVSCGTKNKLVQETGTKIETTTDSTCTQVAITQVDSTSENSEWEWEWQPYDSTATTQAVIIQPDGTKVIIPRGVLKGKKKSKQINGLHIKKDSSSVKKSTDSEVYDYKREKYVHREPGLGIWPWLIVILIISIIILHRIVKKDQ